MFLSVVIPTYNGREMLGECLPSVFTAAARCGAPEIEVIVVDDCSTDGTASWCRDAWPRARVVALAGNVGFAGAANAGVRAARGEWIALLNNDTVVDGGWIAGARLGERDERTGAVASKILRHGQSGEVESAGDGYTTAGLAYQRSSGRLADGAVDPQRPAFSACAAAAFYRRAAIEAAGGFDPRFESYYEDVDLSFRLNLLGWRVEYEPRSVCRHRVGATYGAAVWKRLRNSARNSEIVFFSCMPTPLLYRHFAAHLAAGAAQAVLRASQGGLLPFLAGKLAFIRCIPWVLRRRTRVQDKRRCSLDDLSALIDRDWFRIHVLDRFKGDGRGRRAAGTPDGATQAGAGRRFSATTRT